jgi:ABC-type nickel/cobalt efflux system permease component RcnA
MTADLPALYATALTVGFVHTLCGPDHYVPFVAMSRVGQWSLRKTILVTVLCGIGHVGSSIALGFIGIAFGVVVFQLKSIENFRGDLAGWLLVAFGLAYFSWGVVRAIRNRPHTHRHAHANGSMHAHQHVHQQEHVHAHTAAKSAATAPQAASGALGARSMTPWVLFVIFLFGPCELLIPLLMYPAAEANFLAVICVTTLFGLATIVTMTGVVVLMVVGARAVRFQRIERYNHALAGLLLLGCGLAVTFGL